jgi:serine/threonine protein kinase/Flp pilus assembly protein TadD
VQEVFLAVADRPPTEQGALLEELASGDEELQREVRRLLTADSGRAAIDRPVDASRVRAAVAGVSPAEEPPMPRSIGGYAILGVLGSGGMGTVYRARQTSPPRDVALKVMNATLATPDAARRFEFEAAVLGRLGHPGIAQIHEAGVTVDQGRRLPFFVMELIEGPPLTDFAERERLDLPQRLRLLIAVCEAVQHAHQRGVVHRDLKPANVLVSEERTQTRAHKGARGREGEFLRASAPSDIRTFPKILDFGIARAMDADEAGQTMLTAVGQFVGTLPYMSPEQVAGDPQRVDTRTDIYALGVIAFELLGGRLPLDLRNMPLTQAAACIRDVEPPRLGQVRASLRGDIETIVAKALEKDKERRYASASDLAADLRRFLAHEPILAHPPTRRYRAARFIRRHRAMASAAALAFLLLTAGVVGTTYGMFQAVEQRDAANDARDALKLAKERAEHEAARAKSVSDFLTRLIESTDPFGEYGLGGQDVTVLQMLDREAARIETEFAGQPNLEAEVRTTLGVAYRNLARIDDAERQLKRALQLHAQADGENSPQYARSLREMAGVLVKRGRTADALTMLEQSLDIETSRVPPDPRSLSLAEARLGLALLAAGEAKEAEQHTRRALELTETVAGDQRGQIAGLCNNLAKCVRVRGDAREAEALYRRAAEMFEAVYGPQSAVTGLAQNNVAQLLSNRGALDEAAALFEKSLASLSRALGDEHPLVGDVLNNMALVQLDGGDFEKAIEFGRRAVEIHDIAYGPDHLDTAVTRHNFAHALREGGHLAEARQAFAQVADVRRAKLGTDNWRTLIAEMYAADCASQLGDSDAAEPILLRVYETLGGSFPADDVRVVGARKRLFEFYTRAGRIDEAAKYAEPRTPDEAP